jgi:hypothetical protein
LGQFPWAFIGKAFPAFLAALNEIMLFVPLRTPTAEAC